MVKVCVLPGVFVLGVTEWWADDVWDGWNREERRGKKFKGKINGMVWYGASSHRTQVNVGTAHEGIPRGAREASASPSDQKRRLFSPRTMCRNPPVSSLDPLSGNSP